MFEPNSSDKFILETRSNVVTSFSLTCGLVKMWYTEARSLWLQDEILKGNPRLMKVAGVENPANLFNEVARES